MEHRAYPKIPTTLASTGLGPSTTWVATEKVHGAQLVVATDGDLVRFGKRKAWLGDDEPFFAWQLLRRDLEAAARALYKARGASTVVRLYGEISGGGYPHVDVPAVPGLSPVQTGIWYSPGIHFMLFDVLIDDEGEGVFLAHREVERLAIVAGLRTPPLVHRGSRAEVDALPVRFASLVPRGLGLPAIEGNVAEGLVLKPDVETRPSMRPVVKRKIADFDEARFDESAPFDSRAALDLQALTELGGRLLNPARLASARSKVGEVDVSALVDEVVLDVLVDLEATFPRAMGDLGAEKEEALRAALARRASGVRSGGS